MNTWKQTFNDTWNILAGRDNPQARAENRRQRLARVKFSQKYLGYLLAANGNVGANVLNTTTVLRTDPLTFPALVLDCQAMIPPFSEVELTRTNPSRTQISIEFLWNNHLFNSNVSVISSINSSIFAETPWLQPFSLEINEILKARIKQTVADGARANVEQGITFRVIGLNKMPCPLAHWRDLENYIKAERQQYPVWLTTYSEDARTINFETTGTGRRTLATTNEAPAPMLLETLCFSRPFFGALDAALPSLTKTKVRITCSDGHVFTPKPVLFSTLFQFSGFVERGPGGGWLGWYTLPVPHYLPKGGTITIELTDANVSSTSGVQNAYELVWRGVTI